MDEFERRLKTIPLARPSRDAKSKIFGSAPGIFAIFRRRIPLGWAALFAVFSGLAGMYLPWWFRGPAPLPTRAVIVQIIKAPSERNVFDFTEPAADFIPGDLTVKVESPKEI